MLLVHPGIRVDFIDLCLSPEFGRTGSGHESQKAALYIQYLLGSVS